VAETRHRVATRAVTYLAKVGGADDEPPDQLEQLDQVLPRENEHPRMVVSPEERHKSVRVLPHNHWERGADVEDLRGNNRRDRDLDHVRQVKSAF
jgi:hypothetical protein